MNQQLLEKIDAHFEEMVAIRRHLHMHPELSFQEQETANYIMQYYQKLGVPVEPNVSGYGLIARIKGNKPGKRIALRADFDALPIQDEKDVPYKSTVAGVMHACGHDGHTATLLIIGKLLWEMRDDLAGEYVLIHQHAEEADPGGAIGMVQAGALNGVDAIFGTHLSSNHPTGMIGYRVGPLMAAVDSFELKIQGKGGHGAHPHQTKDAIVIGSQLVMNLQQLVARRVAPTESAVLTVGSFVASNADNIIADTAYLNGTIRTFDKEVRETMEREFKRVVHGTEIAQDCTIELDYRRGYPAIVNHEKETYFVRDIAQDICDVVEIPATMGGEDFAYYLEEKPGTFFFTGAAPTEYAPHHHPKFDIDEKGMLVAAKVMLNAALEYQYVK
ncbi:amidohydrolase [Lysinibacillus sphaericus]|uniref:Amidohydrolase n=1 Tax=Lysinibacillus sphaericus TaxID=1421 RepID=A0A2S0JX21_LYSSH|nr:amidohydrolase [Lysinibacillus sphaericus]AVK95514.1 peptidase M20 [Lysinibacillus sphaericus]MED4546119.1 amidohydrolase [Lysinibacillus sphaericus]TKI16959.1 amidohydrolase [Lysinibacillus sphaericus]UDK98314.1 amidohydrolase [Lysinibacillus sphaericus]SUV18854.1 amidohydrolase [Lysinibacillus sphaericus]